MGAIPAKSAAVYPSDLAARFSIEIDPVRAVFQGDHVIGTDEPRVLRTGFALGLRQQRSRGLLANGELTTKITMEVAGGSEKAIAALEALGGKFTALVGPKEKGPRKPVKKEENAKVAKDRTEAYKAAGNKKATSARLLKKKAAKTV